MVQNNLINIEVAYASKDKQWLIPVSLNAVATVEDAINSSGILQLCPEINLEIHKIGIFGHQVNLTSVVNEGDRIEIYRPLLIDPKQARLLRANKKK